MTLTGRTRYRVGLLGKIILQVEYSYGYLPIGCRPSPDGIATRNDWRDANIADVFNGRVPAAPPQSEDAA